MVAYPVSHTLGALICDTDLSLPLFCCYIVAGHAEQKYSEESLVERCSGAFHGRPHTWIYVMSAVLTHIVMLAFHLVKLAVAFALRTLEPRTSVAINHDVPKAGIIIWKAFWEFVESHCFAVCLLGICKPTKYATGIITILSMGMVRNSCLPEFTPDSPG